MARYNKFSNNDDVFKISESKEMFKPEHEKNPEFNVDYMAQRAVEKVMKQTFEQNDEHLPFLKRKFFVGLDLAEGDKSEKSANDDKIFFMVMLSAVGWLFLGFLLASYFTNILKVPLLLYIILVIITGIIFVSIIVSIFGIDLESKRMERSIRGGKNVASSLASIWGINHASIRKDEYENLNLMYKGETAVILKMLKKSTLVSHESADKIHYEELTKIEDVLTSNNCTFTKYNTRYNPENDEIWDRLNDNLEKASRITSEKYSQLMSDILNYHYDLTLKYSSVSVIYLIIKPPARLIDKEIQQIVHKIKTISLNTRMEISNVSYTELMRVFRDYYGVDYLDIEEIASSTLSDLLEDLEIKELYHVKDDGTLVKLKDLDKTKLNISSDLKSDKNYEEYNDIFKNKTKNEDNYKVINIFEDNVYIQK